jgi:predicted DNA-binding transcriptional regulator AlpA
MNHTDEEVLTVEPMVDVKRVSAVYGNPPSWWYASAEAGKIPSYKVGKYLRFRLSEIEAWLASQRRGPRPEALGR